MNFKQIFRGSGNLTVLRTTKTATISCKGRHFSIEKLPVFFVIF